MAPDTITFQGGPLDGLSFAAPEWPPRPEYPWPLVREAAVFHDRSTAEAGRYLLQGHSQMPEPYPDGVNVFRGGRYVWDPVPLTNIAFDGETQRANLN